MLFGFLWPDYRQRYRLCCGGSAQARHGYTIVMQSRLIPPITTTLLYFTAPVSRSRFKNVDTLPSAVMNTIHALSSGSIHPCHIFCVSGFEYRPTTMLHMTTSSFRITKTCSRVAATSFLQMTVTRRNRLIRRSSHQCRDATTY